MDSDKLRLFVSIAETGSMSKTANEFFTTEQSISKAMRMLERTEGQKLLNTSSRGSALTEYGEKYYNFAKNFIAEEEQLLEKIKKNKQQRLSGEINIGCIQAMLANIVPEVVMFTLKNYPQVKINVHENTSRNIINRILNKQDDLGFVVNNYTDCHKELNIPRELKYIKISDIHCEFWSRQDLRKQGYDKLKQYKIIIYSKYDVSGLSFFFNTLGLNIEENYFFTDNIHLIKRLVQEGLAICPDVVIFKKGIVFGDLFNGSDICSYHLLPENYHSELGIVKRRNAHAIEEFLKELIQMVITNFSG